MEVLNLLLTSDQTAVKNLLASYSSNETAKEHLLEALLTQNPYDVNVDYSNLEENETKKLVETLMFNLGLSIDDIKEIDSLEEYIE